MNTNKLKPFAQKARKILIDGVEKRILYWGFDKKGNVVEELQKVQGGTVMRGKVIDDESFYSKWRSLKAAVNQIGIREVAEEAAYTWFNRLLAIKILGKNGYDPEQLAFESETLKVPLIISRARKGQTNFLTAEENKRLQLRLPDFEKDDESFGILLLAYCHDHPLIHNVFGRTDDYTELLLPDNILSEQGFLHLLNTIEAITEDDFRQVELIGWLYQFYISEKKEELFSFFKKNKKAAAKEIPAATQIFTPNWIVKYMTQNTVGKLWLEKEPNSPLRQQMKYLVEAEGTQDETMPIFEGIEQLKLMDPAVGSGHILVEAFQLLFEIYMEEMYTEREAVESILQNNLFGVDIDLRAVQLARFAVLLIAAQKHKDILRSGMMPHIYAMPAPAEFTTYEIQDFLGKEGLQYQEALTQTLELMQQAQNLGSVMQFELTDACRDFLIKRLTELDAKRDKTFGELAVLPKITPFIIILKLLTDKYETVVANPPYMGKKLMNSELSAYLDKNYRISKSDLMAVFIQVCSELNKPNGIAGLVTLDSWMFLSSYEKLRKELIEVSSFNSLIHIGWNSFPHGHLYNRGVGFCIKKAKNENGVYINLSDVEATVDKHELFLKRNISGESKYNKPAEDFSKIPGSPIAYWAGEKVVSIFKSTSKLNQLAPVKKGLSTGNNNKYLRLWHEVSHKKLAFNTNGKSKWFPYNKGGEFRKWYGNRYYVLNWENDGAELKNDSRSVLRNRPFYLKDCLTWSAVTSGKFSARACESGFIFDGGGSCAFPDPNLKNYLLGFFCSELSNYFLGILIPTLNFEIGTISSLPVKTANDKNKALIDELVKDNVDIVKNEWDSREISWNFRHFPLIQKHVSLSQAFFIWEEQIQGDYFKLHKNELLINEVLIDIYELNDSLETIVPLNEVTLFIDEIDQKKLEKLESICLQKGEEAIELPIRKDIIMQQLISYAVGCMMGRYRLDQPGLQIAHPNPTAEEACTYTYNGLSFAIDEDAIIPLMGSGSNFPDDAVNRFRHFLEVVWGEETLTENLNFLQACLDQDLEKYMVRDFWKDHCRRYKKKPIYWLFASPNNAFQVLVYMHRMSPYTVDTIRSKYLLPHMQYLQNAIDHMEANAANLNAGEQRQLDKLRAQFQECQGYDLHLKDIADRQINIDLDDGVAVNYPKFEPVVAPIK